MRLIFFFFFNQYQFFWCLFVCLSLFLINVIFTLFICSLFSLTFCVRDVLYILLCEKGNESFCSRLEVLLDEIHHFIVSYFYQLTHKVPSHHHHHHQHQLIKKIIKKKKKKKKCPNSLFTTPSNR